MRNCKPILLVEDDRSTTQAVEKALNELKVVNRLRHIADSRKALNYLKEKDTDKPCVILLDFNISKTNGVEFTREVKAHKKLNKIPIVAITTWATEKKVIEKLDLDIASYIAKPIDYLKFIEAIRACELFWTLTESQKQKNGG